MLPALLHDLVFSFCREQIYSLLRSLLRKIRLRGRGRGRRNQETEEKEKEDEEEPEHDEGYDEQDEEENAWMNFAQAAEWQRVVMQISDVVLHKVHLSNGKESP